MASFRFVHAADLHLDTPFEGVAGPAPAVAQALQDASLAAWDNVVRLTIDSEASLLLIAGDIYDGADRGVRAQLRFFDGLKRLSSAGVETLFVYGNHDPLDGWSAVREWPSGVTEFGSDEVKSVPVRVDGGQTVHVHGISYRSRHVQDNLAKRFMRSQGKALNIGLLHANAGGNADHASYAPCSLGDLDAAGMDYWALGHIHKQQFLRKDGPWIAYSGDTQGRSPKPSETGAKGVLLAQVSGTSIESVTFQPVDLVRFATCAIDIANAVDVPTLQAQVTAGVDALREENAGRSLVVRVVLEGRGPTASDLHHEGTLADLRTEMRAGYEGLQPFVWLESLRNRSHAVLDLEALRKRDDFRAVLLRMADGLLEDPEALEAFVGRAGSLLDKPGQVERALRALESEDAGEILGEALELALDGLEREEGS